MSQISLTIEQALDSASKSLEAGQLAQCEQLLRLVLQADPQQPDALHLFGLLCVRVGEAAAGVGFIEQAIALRADWPEAQRSYAYALAKSGRRGDAIKHLITWCMVHASDAEAWLMLAKHLQRVGQLDEARKALTAALTAQPGWAYAYTALGHLELQAQQFSHAIAAYSAALTANPDDAEAECGMGSALQAKGRLAEAEAYFLQALAQRPNYFEALCNLANTQRDMGKVDEALQNLEQAVEMKPDSAIARYNLGWTKLLTGDFAGGWPDYAYRHQVMPATTAIPQHCPRWQGENLEGKRLLLLKEQGYGDQIQFVRYTPFLAQAGALIDLRISSPLKRLFATLPGVARLNPADEGIEHDYWCSLLDLPGLFGTTLENIPAGTPYLAAEEVAIARWRNKLGDGIKVGLVWAGSPKHGNDHYRSLTLDTLEPLAEVAGVRFVSLQKGPAAAAVANAPFVLYDTDPDLADFADTAALLGALDLLIAVDTSVVHLAGALARPVWALLPANPDWRWMRYRSDSPWYPSMCLFRQPELGDWETVIETVRLALEAFVAQRQAR